MQLSRTSRNYKSAVGIVLITVGLLASVACGRSPSPPQSSTIDSYLKLPERCIERLQSGVYVKGEKGDIAVDYVICTTPEEGQSLFEKERGSEGGWKELPYVR